MAEIQDFIRWDGSMKLGIPILDEQHVNLVRIADNLQLTNSKSSDHTHNRFIGAASEAIEYIKYHFATEEKLMRLLEYPNYNEHINEHKDCLWDLLYSSSQFKNEQNADFRQFVIFLNEWIVTHISDSDKDFANYFHSMQHHSKLKVLAVGGLA
ncbi:MAG: hemerythrin family protein [Treponema sp.]|nr:hemerythrin family protein [Treponema sp.]